MRKSSPSFHAFPKLSRAQFVSWVKNPCTNSLLLGCVLPIINSFACARRPWILAMPHMVAYSWKFGEECAFSQAVRCSPWRLLLVFPSAFFIVDRQGHISLSARSDYPFKALPRFSLLFCLAPCLCVVVDRAGVFFLPSFFF